jgi:histidinol-phosphatase
MWEAELDVAMAAARAAGEAALPFFGQAGAVTWKADDSPVGEADHAADAAILRHLHTAFPEDAILSEESGERAGRRGRRWIVDPVDGTRDFLRGLPYWANLIALEVGGDVAVGVLHLPALGKLYGARRGGGAWRSGSRLEIRHTPPLSRCYLVLGELSCLARAIGTASLERLVCTVGAARAFGAPYGAALVLDGHADAWSEGDVSTWDIAPFLVLLEEAGARFTDFQGHQGWPCRSGLAAREPLHGALIDLLRPASAGTAEGRPFVSG